MAHTTCLVCLVSTTSGHCKNALGRGSASVRHITKLEQSIFLDTHDATVLPLNIRQDHKCLSVENALAYFSVTCKKFYKTASGKSRETPN
jgi:hypothetical protein